MLTLVFINLLEKILNNELIKKRHRSKSSVRSPVAKHDKTRSLSPMRKGVGSPENNQDLQVPTSKNNSNIQKSSLTNKENKKPKSKKAVDAKGKKRIKQYNIVDVYGQQFMAATKIEDYNLFNDLNYGDMAMVFNNPYYDFLMKEREEIEMYEFNHLKLLKGTTMAKLNLSAKETRKMEQNNINGIQNIKDKYKKILELESNLNVRIDLQDAYDFYSKFINLKPEKQVEKRKGEKHQKMAFANALIYFSDRYYVNDMGKIKSATQPYSDMSSQSLRDFLLDSIFEFNIFHTIAKRKLFSPKNEDGEVSLGGTEEHNPLGYSIKDKPKSKQTIFQAAISNSEKREAFKQVFKESSNYYFVKRPEFPINNLGEQQKMDTDKRTNKEIVSEHYSMYLDLTLRMNKASQIGRASCRERVLMPV